MINIHNNEEFWQSLHELEEDPYYYEHVGNESRTNVYIDDGDPNVDVEIVARERRQLKKVRELLGLSTGIKKKSRSNPKRSAIRLMVTWYRQFDLTYREIAKLLEMPYSTIRHDYPALKPQEKLKGDFTIELRDKFGRHIKANEI